MDVGSPLYSVLEMTEVSEALNSLLADGWRVVQFTDGGVFLLARD